MEGGKECERLMTHASLMDSSLPPSLSLTSFFPSASIWARICASLKGGM